MFIVSIKQWTRKYYQPIPHFVCNIDALIPRALPSGFVLLYCIQTSGSWLLEAQIPRDKCFYITYKARDGLITPYCLLGYNKHVFSAQECLPLPSGTV